MEGWHSWSTRIESDGEESTWKERTHENRGTVCFLMVIVEEWAFAISNNLGNFVTMSRMRRSFGESAGREMHIPTVCVSFSRRPVQEEILVDFPMPTEEAPEPGAMFQRWQLDKGHVVKVTTPFSHPLDDVEGFKNPHRQLQFMRMTMVDYFEEYREVDPQTGQLVPRKLSLNSPNQLPMGSNRI